MSSAVIRLVDLREEPLDVAEVVAALDDDASGGLTLFVGRVRDHDRARASSGSTTPPTRRRSTSSATCASGSRPSTT